MNRLGSCRKPVVVLEQISEVYRNLTTQKPSREALTHFVDRMILLAKRGDDLSRREAGEWLFDESSGKLVGREGCPRGGISSALPPIMEAGRRVLED